MILSTPAWCMPRRPTVALERVSVYLSLCAVSNHIRRFKRPSTSRTAISRRYSVCRTTACCATTTCAALEGWHAEEALKPPVAA